MKRFFLSFIIPILTFFAGVYVYKNSSPNVSLETVSKYTSFYDGIDVEIETYAQLEESIEVNLWSIGEPFDKAEAWTFLDLENNTTNLENLSSQLKENFSRNNYKRVKVLVKGKVQDNCKMNITRCCFGKTMTIKTREVIQLAPVEDYSRPR